MNIPSNQVLLFYALLLGVGLTLVKWHLSRNNFSLLDLVCTDGKLNDKKFIRTGSWVVMTYGFYVLIEDGKDLVAYGGLYGALWVGNAALDKYQRLQEAKNNVEPPKRTV